MKSRNNIGITMGDPAGIGPEIIAKALAKPSIRRLGSFTLIGDKKIFSQYLPREYKNCSFVDKSPSELRQCKAGHPNKQTGLASLKYIETAINFLKDHKITSLVTGPVSKEAIAYSQKDFQGHTEYLAQAFNCKEFGMFFICRHLRVILATRHIPLREVPRSLSAQNLFSTFKLCTTALKQLFHIPRPHLAVCGLNPHAGEGGRIGKEEGRIIQPAIKKALAAHMKVSGPFAADTLFGKNVSKNYDAIVAMYHDQGLVALKTNYLNTLVNLTIGLPFIRTSPAHGTAFNIAGKNIANPDSMAEAIKLAAQLP